MPEDRDRFYKHYPYNDRDEDANDAAAPSEESLPQYSATPYDDEAKAATAHSTPLEADADSAIKQPEEAPFVTESTPYTSAGADFVERQQRTPSMDAHENREVARPPQPSPSRDSVASNPSPAVTAPYRDAPVNSGQQLQYAAPQKPQKTTVSRPQTPYYTTPPQGGSPKKKGTWRKRILATVGSLVAVAVIALASIGAYTLLTGPTEPDSADAQTNTPVVQKLNDGNTLSVAEIAEKVTPSVVSIVSTIQGQGMFGMSQEGQGSGTGIIMTDDGYILTNAHVINGASSVKVTLEDGTEYDAHYVGADSKTDVGILKIEATGLPAADFGDSSALRVGEDVVIIGNPLGTELTGTVGSGIISNLDVSVAVEGEKQTFIQTNAGINSGNSGGPLLNMEGKVIGVNTAKVDSSVAEGIGFALPINDVLPVANELIENGYVTGRPLIGITGQDMDQSTAELNNVPTGVLVVTVTEGTGAAEAGLQPEDIITEVEGTAISSMDELNTEKDKHKVGDTITVTVYRHSTGETFKAKITLAEQMGE